KAAKAEPTPSVVKNELAGVIRTTVLHLIAHTAKQGLGHATLAGSVFPNSTDSTHYLNSTYEVRPKNLQYSLDTLCRFGSSNRVVARFSRSASSSSAQTGTINQLTFECLLVVFQQAVIESRRSP